MCAFVSGGVVLKSRAGRCGIRHGPGVRSAEVGVARRGTGPRMTQQEVPAAAPCVTPETDIYGPFWEHANQVLKDRLSDLSAYPIPAGMEVKEEITGKNTKRATWVKTTSHAYQTPKLRQIRAGRVQGGAALQVLNFVVFPDLNYRLPFFGADLVTLPGGHLIALDLQPLFHDEAYYEEFYDGLKAIHKKYQDVLPWGGDFPEEARPFFSPCFLWTRPEEKEKVDNEVLAAFKEYLDYYLQVVEKATPVTDPEELQRIEERQKAYLDYRASKDPARPMFVRFYGSEWAEEYIHDFLFDLENRIKDGSYQTPLSKLSK